MFPSFHRLLRTSIKQIMLEGRRFKKPELTLIYQANSLDTSRFTILVPMYMDKRAVVRNRVKRLLREAVCKLLPEIRRNIDGVIIVRKSMSSLEEAVKSVKGLTPLFPQ